MKISELWSRGGAEWRDKTIDQWVVAAGSGKLTDRSDTSRDMRDLLRIVDFEQLRKFATQCLESKSTAGLALQDVINAIGERLGFVVEYGLYQGTSRNAGFDGLWSADGDYIVVEVKTTDAYRMALATGRRYVDRLIDERALPRDRCSILYVVGRFDTGDFEAQFRGSQLAWTARIVSVDALCRLLAISATLGDPQDRRKIYSLLRPFEYTKVDDIINLVFAAAEAPEKSRDTQIRTKARATSPQRLQQSSMPNVPGESVRASVSRWFKRVVLSIRLPMALPTLLSQFRGHTETRVSGAAGSRFNPITKSFLASRALVSHRLVAGRRQMF